MPLWHKPPPRLLVTDSLNIVYHLRFRPRKNSETWTQMFLGHFLKSWIYNLCVPPILFKGIGVVRSLRRSSARIEWKLKESDAESQVFEDMTVRSLEEQADVVKRLYFLSTRTSSLGGNFSWLSVKKSIYKALNGKHMTPARDQGWAGLPAIN